MKIQIVKTIVLIVSALVLCVQSYAQYDSADRLATTPLAQAINFANAGLYEDAKRLIVRCLNEEQSDIDEAEARFVLAQVLVQEGKEKLAIRQWIIIVSEFPDTEFADVVNRLLRTRFVDAYAFATSHYEDELFRGYFEMAELFWHYEEPDFRFNVEELRDPLRALDFYEMLHAKFEDPRKRAYVRYAQIMLLAGLNDDDFGFLNANRVSDSDQEYWQRETGAPWQDPISVSHMTGPDSQFRDDPRISQQKKFSRIRTRVEGGNKNDELRSLYLASCEVYLDELEDSCPVPQLTAEAYYWLGVATSDVSHWSGKVAATEISSPYFDKVMEHTEDQPFSLLRIMCAYWLAESDS